MNRNHSPCEPVEGHVLVRWRVHSVPKTFKCKMESETSAKMKFQVQEKT